MQGDRFNSGGVRCTVVRGDRFSRRAWVEGEGAQARGQVAGVT